MGETLSTVAGASGSTTPGSPPNAGSAARVRRASGQLPILREMLNASFAQLGYYTPISADKLPRRPTGWRSCSTRSCCCGSRRTARPVAFVVAVPDISEFLMAVGGRLGIVNRLRLLADPPPLPPRRRLMIKGTVPEEQGHGYLTLLSRELHRGLRAGGYPTLRSTFVERDNLASAAQYRRLGGRPLHGYTFYERESDWDERLRALEAVVWRAPSAHNTQPWRLPYGAAR